jgi:O-antigen ligase
VTHNTSRRAVSEPWNVRLAGLYRGGPQGARFALFTLLLVLTAWCGGSSWATAWPLLLLRPAAVLLATAILLLPGPVDRTVLRAPGLLLVALALTMLVQLVPLPPTLWSALPGHAPFIEAAAAAGMPQPWRPVTLSIDATLNSLVALAVPGAILLAGAALRPDQRITAAGLVVGLAVASALLGILQVTLGPSFHLYALSSVGRPDGFFANINHQATLLAAVIPVTAAWAFASRSPSPLRVIVAGLAGLLLLATILVSGSRSGLLLAALAVLSVPLVIGNRLSLSPSLRWLVLAGAAVLTVALVAATWLAGRLGGIDRLLDSGADHRFSYLPITWGLLRDYAPLGSGYGTFNAVFRHTEPDTVLKLTYFNHAHNDLLELGITGGLAAVAVAVAYVAWLAWHGVGSFRAERHMVAAPLGRAGLCCALLLLLASLTDYPLRTPLIAAMLALASLWVADRRASAR